MHCASTGWQPRGQLPTAIVLYCTCPQLLSNAPTPPRPLHATLLAESAAGCTIINEFFIKTVANYLVSMLGINLHNLKLKLFGTFFEFPRRNFCASLLLIATAIHTLAHTDTDTLQRKLLLFMNEFWRLFCNACAMRREHWKPIEIVGPFTIEW